MKDEFKFFLRNLNDTRNLANYLSKEVEKKAFISLKGDLGAGKTTFARYFVNALSYKPKGCQENDCAKLAGPRFFCRKCTTN